MKKLILIILLSPFISKSQSLLSFNDDCGTWEIDTTYERVISTDTIKYILWGSSDDWIYSDLIYYDDGSNLAVYCPCGCGHSDIEDRYRINSRGIRQRIRKVTLYKYIPKPETEYQRKLKQLQ